ncbi:hypothetical protein ISCGN_021358 [Ixodes scapularis]
MALRIKPHRVLNAIFRRHLSSPAIVPLLHTVTVVRFAHKMWMIIVFCCFVVCTASETSVSNLYMDTLLKIDGPPGNQDYFEVPEFNVTVREYGVVNPKLSVTFRRGHLLNCGTFERRGDCEGPVRLVGSAYIKCTVLLRGFEVLYRGGEYSFHFGTSIGGPASVDANILATKAKVEFRHFKGNQTEEVRVTVDEVGIQLGHLMPYVKYVPQEIMFRDAVQSKMNETLSNVIPEILADRIIFAMDHVNFPLP